VIPLQPYLLHNEPADQETVAEAEEKKPEDRPQMRIPAMPRRDMPGRNMSGRDMQAKAIRAFWPISRGG